jgi:hypothetical protein
MHGGLETFHIADLNRETDAAVKWLSVLGLKCSQGRMQVYRETLDKITDLWVGGKLAEYVRAGNEFEVVTALLEAQELATIHSGLKNELRSSSLDKLRKYVTGPFSYVLEKPDSTSTTSPRNFGFELSLESQLINADFHIVEDTDEDIAFESRTHLYCVECKRPQREMKASQLISDADSQLKKRYMSGRKHNFKRGIFALSLTKALNPESQILYAKDEADLYDGLVEMGNKVFHQDEERWERKLHPQTAGGWFQWSLIAHLESTNKITYCQFGFLTNRHKNPMDSAILDAVEKQLRYSVDTFTPPLAMGSGSFQQNLSRSPFNSPWRKST